jgi:transposase-like protein
MVPQFGQDYANQIHRRRPRTSDKWRLDEVFLTINGKRHYPWRGVDQDNNVLDIFVQSRRNKKAAKKFFRKLLKGLQYVPCVVITDKLKSYGAAKREILPGVSLRGVSYHIINWNKLNRIHYHTIEVRPVETTISTFCILPVREADPCDRQLIILESRPHPGTMNAARSVRSYR